MRAFKFTTLTGTPVINQISGGQPTAFMGATSDNLETSTTIYLKLWWQGDVSAIPVIGTTPPSATIPIPAGGLAPFSFIRALQMAGPLWYAVTKLGADADTTALSTAGETVTLFLE